MRLLAAILLWTFSCSMLFSQNTPWKLRKSTDGVEVYFRKSEHSPINEIRIRTTLNGDIKTLLEIMRNVKGYNQWVYKCTSAELLSRPSASEAIYYAVMDFPWPLNDRDFVAGSKIYQTPQGKVVITVKGVPDRVPEKPEHVRVPLLDYRWEFRPADNSVIHLDYYLRSDPGGELPAWLINLVIDQGPTNTVKNLRDLMERKSEIDKGS